MRATKRLVSRGEPSAAGGLGLAAYLNLNRAPAKGREARPHPYSITADRLVKLGRASDDNNVAGMLAHSLYTSAREGDTVIDATTMAAILDSLKDPFLFADTEHMIRYMNRAAIAHYKEGASLIGCSLQ